MRGFTYDRFALQYDSFMAAMERLGLGGMRAAAIEHLPQNGSILEIGAGTGLNFCYYSKEAQVIATEPSHAMVARAQERLATSRIPASARAGSNSLTANNKFVTNGAGSRSPDQLLVRSNAEELPFSGCSFDAACATLVFCSVSEPALAFRELLRVVRSGAPIVLLEHVRAGGVLGLTLDFLSLFTVPLFSDHLNRSTAEEARRSGLMVEVLRTWVCGIFQLILCRKA